MPKCKWPKIGDKVIVPFGGYGATGTVIDVYGISTVSAVVEFKVDPEADEPTVIAYYVDELRPAEAA